MDGEHVLHLDDSLCSQLYGELFKVEFEERPRAPGSKLVAFKDDHSSKRPSERMQIEEPLTSEDEEEEDDVPPADEVKEEESVVAANYA